MKVGIITSPQFNDMNFLDQQMEELIEESQCYLFTICCSPESAGDRYCQLRGCPREIVKEWEFFKKVNFFLIIDDANDNSIKNIAMKIKMMEDKHGKYVRY